VSSESVAEVAVRARMPDAIQRHLFDAHIRSEENAARGVGMVRRRGVEQSHRGAVGVTEKYGGDQAHVLWDGGEHVECLKVEVVGCPWCRRRGPAMPERENAITCR
jgi:hypothetical protein